MDWVLKPFLNYASFQGRSTRKEFWIFALLFAVVTVAAHFIDARDGEIVPIAGGMGALELTAQLVLILPFITVGARRLHDTGRSGWWLLFLYLPWLATTIAVGSERAMIAAAGAFIVGALVLIVQLCLPGEAGENRFGPDPRREVSAP